MKATPIRADDASREEVVTRALEMIPNTAPFDVTGHPAMTVPCGLSDDLPVGMMLVGRKGDEQTILRAAHAFEQTGTYTVRLTATTGKGECPFRPLDERPTTNSREELGDPRQPPGRLHKRYPRRL